MKIQNLKLSLLLKLWRAKKIQNSLLFIIFFSFLFLPLVSLAAGLVPCGGEGEPRCQPCHLLVLLKNVLDFVFFKLVPPVAVFVLVVGGVMMMLAIPVGDPDKINQAKEVFRTLFIGLILIYGAWILINTFFMVIGVAEWTGLREGWWKINCPT